MSIAGAGIILVRQGSEEGSYQTLLLQGTDTDKWSFPKGHPEPEDKGNTLCTAIRETYEETGFLINTHFTIHPAQLRLGKRIYWIGLMKPDYANAPVRLQDREHRGAGWFYRDEIAVFHQDTNADIRLWLKKTESGASKFDSLMASFASFSILGKHCSVMDHNGSLTCVSPNRE